MTSMEACGVRFERRISRRDPQLRRMGLIKLQRPRRAAFRRMPDAGIL